MSKIAIADELVVLRFFEHGPLEKAEVMFNIVSEKMRERLEGQKMTSSDSIRPSRRLSRKIAGEVPADGSVPSTGE